MAAIIAALVARKTSANYMGFGRTVPLETLILETSVTKAKCTFPKQKAAVSLSSIIRSVTPSLTIAMRVLFLQAR